MSSVGPSNATVMFEPGLKRLPENRTGFPTETAAESAVTPHAADGDGDGDGDGLADDVAAIATAGDVSGCVAWSVDGTADETADETAEPATGNPATSAIHAIVTVTRPVALAALRSSRYPNQVRIGIVLDQCRSGPDVPLGSSAPRLTDRQGLRAVRR